MLVDLLFLTLCLLFAVVGGFSGFLKQLVHLVALGGAWVAARLTGPHLARLLTGSLGLHPIAALGAGSVLAGTLAFVVVLLGGRLAVRRLRGAGGPRPWERALGVLLGAAKTGTLLSLVLGLIVLADGFVPLRLLPKDSEVVRLVRRHNPVAALPLPLETLHRSLARVATARQGGSDDPLAQALAADPTVGAAAADPRVLRALEEGELSALMRHGLFRRLLTDPKLVEQLERASHGGRRARDVGSRASGKQGAR